MSLKDVSSQKVKSLMVAAKFLPSCPSARIIEGGNIKIFSSQVSLFLTRKSENQKLFKKSQEVDCLSVSVTGTVSHVIAGWKMARDRGSNHHLQC